MADNYLYYYDADCEKRGLDRLSEEVSEARAFKLYTESAYRNSSYGQFQLAYCYENGYGCECNYSLAAQWYKEALSNGCCMAAGKLGDFYYKGLGVKQDYNSAVSYYLMYDLTGADVCMRLSKCYSKGIGVEADDKKAFKYLNRAYELGSKKPCQKLAECYLKGIGVEKDIEKSKIFLKKSAAQRNNVSDLIRNYYYGQEIIFLNRIKGLGYILLSHWDYISAVSAVLAFIIGGEIIINL